MTVKWTIVRGFVLFVILVIASSLVSQFFQVEFGNVNFFLRHGWIFLICITFFPRLTLLFSSVPFGGFLWWMGLIFCPRILVASLATINYFKTNPVLVVISWLIALGGETFEKWGLGRNKVIFRTYRGNAHYQSQGQSYTGPENKVQNSGDVIEAEYTVKKDDDN
jgi:hypothetical protein